MYYMNEKGERVYTLQVRERGRRRARRMRVARARRRQPYGRATDAPDFATQKTAPDGTPTLSAHPARFSPDDKFSKQRVALKKRFSLLPTQQPEVDF